MLQSIVLSQLCCGKNNPRRVRPQREAHRRLVASIKAFGLLEPLVVRPVNGDGRYQVIAGNRRLAALQELYRGVKKPPKIACEVRPVEDADAQAISLSENFVREPMHPLDEAQTFARLAGEEGKDTQVIASEFGVSVQYVRQRMKLAALAQSIQQAYRQGKLDTTTAEAFAAVPPDQQLKICQELRGLPRDAQQVRSIIHNQWIDASHALFDVSALPASAVSRDLFSEQVLVERSAFMEAQSQALEAQRQSLVEEGWAEAVAARRPEVLDRLYAMAPAEPQLDPATQTTLDKLKRQRQKLEAQWYKADGNESRQQTLQRRLKRLNKQEQTLLKNASRSFAEDTKATGTAFLVLEPDGQVRREYRVPRPERSGTSRKDKTKVPTSEDLRDSQLSLSFAHQTLALRRTVLQNPLLRKRLLALILHEKIASEALSVRHPCNGVSLQVQQDKEFISPITQQLQALRQECDPFVQDAHVEDCEAWERLGKLDERQLDALIELLIVECLTAHPSRPTALIAKLVAELDVPVRQFWRPDERWLSGYQKIQLCHLLSELYGSLYNPRHEQRSKSGLVKALAKLFADAAEGVLEDKRLAERVNRWLPVNLRSPSEK